MIDRIVNALGIIAEEGVPAIALAGGLALAITHGQPGSGGPSVIDRVIDIIMLPVEAGVKVSQITYEAGESVIETVTVDIPREIADPADINWWEDPLFGVHWFQKNLKLPW